MGHTFAIPGLHLFVPVASPNTALVQQLSLRYVALHVRPALRWRSSASRRPDHGGTFRWQCLVPCGGGFLDGNGGPMQTIGYMMGNMEVTA